MTVRSGRRSRPARSVRNRSRHVIVGTDSSPVSEILGWQAVATAMHDARIEAVMARLLDAETLLDLGCGAGLLLRRLIAEPHIRRIVGVDSSPRALLLARQLLASGDGSIDARLELRQASVTDMHPDLEELDAAVMVETIEHLDPSHLCRLERSLFACLRPRMVIITTPNREYNTLLGLRPDEFRHPDHRFEWERRRFESWSAGVARRNGYSVEFDGVGPANAWFGSSTQMAVFHSEG